MPIDTQWDISKIKNSNEVCYKTRNADGEFVQDVDGNYKLRQRTLMSIDATESVKRNKITKNNIKVLGKIIAEAYGVVKIIDNTLHNLESNLESVIMIKKLIEILRTDLSDTIEEMLVGNEED